MYFCLFLKKKNKKALMERKKKTRKKKNMFKVNKVTRERCRFGVFIVNFEYISHFF